MFQGKLWGYGPAFLTLFIVAVFSFYELRDNRCRLEVKSFLRDNKALIITTALYLIATAASAWSIGSIPNAAYVFGSAIIMGTLLLFIPLGARERESLVFLIRLLYFVGLFSASIGLVLLVLKWSHGLSVGIFPTSQFLPVSDSKAQVLQMMNVPYALKGLFWHPNSLGILLAFVFPAGMFLLHQARLVRHKLLYMGGFVLLLIAMACACAFISLVPVCMALLLSPIIRNQTVFSLVRAFIFTMVMAINMIVMTGSDLTWLQSLPITSTIRVDIWNQAIRTIQQHPLFGVGATHTAGYLPFGFSAHNTFIEIALGNGISAMILYSAFLLALLRRIRLTKDADLSAYMILTFLTFFILQLFETQILGGMSIANFYLLMVAIAYLSILSRAAARNTKPRTDPKEEESCVVSPCH